MEQYADAPIEEAALVARAKAGDEAAWEALVTTYQQPIYRLAYLLLGDGDEAEDIAQDTFIRAFRALATFDETRPLRPWLLQIATNLVRNRRRSVGRYLQALTRMVRGEPEPVATLGERSGEQWEARTLWRAIRRLSPGDQEIMYARYFLDLSEAEMASALGIAAGTVKSRLHRATGRLRAIVERDFPALGEGRQG
jgi:RNA polymerase sigma-70 factor (ECF subfamily)